jgi:serine/threonine protein kinase
MARALHCYSKQKKLFPKQLPEAVEYDWIIAKETVVLGQKIGQGGFSNVYLAKYLNSDVAAKVFEASDISDLDIIIHEAKIWQSLRHDHIVPLIGVCLNPNQPFILSQYCKNGTVKSYLKNQDFEPTLCIKFM